MRDKPVTVEQSLYLLAFGLGLGFRLLNLGIMPLSDPEAGLALQALDISSAKSPLSLAPQPAYLSLTAATFALLGSTNFLARLWPALVGATLILAPYYLRRLLGREAALILAFGLALDPGLVAVARMAVGPAMALGFTALALGLAWHGQRVGAGVFAALALLSGPSFWPGLLSLILVWGFFRLRLRSGLSLFALPPVEGSASEKPALEMREVMLAGLITLFLVGTMFFRFPQGLGALVMSLPAYLRGWWQPSDVPPLRLLVALAVYQPLAVIFALAGIGRAWLRRDVVGQGLSLWLITALLLVVLYPARQVGDVTWALLPVWALAARELAIWLPVAAESGGRNPVTAVSGQLIAGLQAVLLTLLFGLWWVNLEGLSRLTAEMSLYWLRLGSMAGVVALGAFVTVFVSIGWTWPVARQGLGWGLCIALGLYGLSALWGGTQIRTPDRVELWQPAPLSGDDDLLRKTLADLSLWNTGRSDSIDVTLAVDSPALRWALRGYPHLTIIAENLAQQIHGSPSIVITRQTEEQPALASAYRGQDFIWWRSPAWEGAAPPAFPRWLAFRQAPLREESVILWARSDLFPGGALSVAPGEAPLQVPSPSREKENPR